MTRRLGDIRPPDIWFAGHRPTGAELERQANALVDAWGMKRPPKITILEAFARMPEGSPTAIIGVPSNTTWSRARHGRPQGPQPLRDQQWPWGFPWLSPTDREVVDQANAEFRYIMTVITEALRRSPETLAMLLHPEQLGAAQRGTPASIWDLPELRVWAKQVGMLRAATFQCRFQPTDFRSPTGILVSHQLNSKLFNPGWPSVRTRAPHYQGPLPHSCACGRRAHRARTISKGRVQHQPETTLIKDGLMRYLLGIILRRCTGMSVTELLRKGSPLTLQVRDDIPGIFDSSESQETWIPSESQSDSAGSPRPHQQFGAPLRWDPELARILGLIYSPISSSSSASSAGSSSAGNFPEDTSRNLALGTQARERVHGSEEVKEREHDREVGRQSERTGKKKGVHEGSRNFSETKRSASNIITMRAWSRKAPHPCAGLRRGGLAATGEGR